MKYDFLIDTYATERVKILSVWSEFRDDDLPVRPKQDDPRGRSVHEQMVHQCVSEDVWFRTMLGIDVGAPPLPRHESRLEFMKRYAEDSGRRLDALRRADESWWEEITTFFDVRTLESVDPDAAPHALLASSRPADGDAEDVGTRPAQQLRTDG